jgi:hypothetical protein
LASKYGGAAFSVELLRALIDCGFAISCSGLVGLDPRDVVGVVDVP